MLSKDSKEINKQDFCFCR